MSVVPFKNKQGRIGKLCLAGVSITDDSREFSMQIEFENDCAITITFWKDIAGDGLGNKVAVAVWTGRGEHDLEDDSIDSFREWAKYATANSTKDEYFGGAK
jgi:hypothetical protein